MPGQGHRRAARVKRQKIWHPGAEAAKRPLPFGRASRWKQTMSGKIVPRYEKGQEFGRRHERGANVWGNWLVADMGDH